MLKRKIKQLGLGTGYVRVLCFQTGDQGKASSRRWQLSITGREDGAVPVMWGRAFQVEETASAEAPGQALA